ncbi:MAG: NUDIX domain-containing protein [Lachnospiraceae bacterium]|nr:NUDIX domain-containing protein [Lachnospiraceae bacterium]
MLKKYNVIMILNQDETRLLMCLRAKEPFKGKWNLVGGKIEAGETEEEAAYRELYEETGISGKDVKLSYLMNFQYFLWNYEMEIFAGVLKHEVPLCEEVNRLAWFDLTENFADRTRFAGEANIQHFVNVWFAAKHPEENGL